MRHSRSPVLETPYRSGLEEKLGEQLAAAGLPFLFEPEKLAYAVPARLAKYTPDFVLIKLDGQKMYIEAKGRFGGGDHKGHGNKTSAEERQKMILVKEQHPDIDLRFIFARGATPIYKGSPTSHSKWADTHGFLWADKGIFPDHWMKEISYV